MNMVYEGIRQNGSMIIVPSSALDGMALGTMSGMAALAGQRADAVASGDVQGGDVAIPAASADRGDTS